MISKIKFIFCFLFLITLVSCIDTLKSPVLPVWDVSYTVPVVNRSEIVADRIKGKSGIFIDSSTQHLLIKFDSTRLESKPLNEIFSDNIKYEDEFTIKTQNVDTVKFESFVSDDSVYLEEFHLFKGNLTYEVFNHLDKRVNINVTIPNLTKISGVTKDTLKFDVTVQPKSSAKRVIDLKNYHYNYIRNPFGGTNYGFYVKGHAKMEPGYTGDSITTKVVMNDLGFNYIKGKTKPYEDSLKTKTVYLDIDEDAKEILPKVQIYGAKIIITPNTTTRNLEVELKNFEVIGSFKSTSLKKNLKIKGKPVLDTIISLDQPSFVINIDDFDINDFLNPQVPDSITYKGKIKINPRYKSIDVTLPDTIKYNVRFLIYSIVKINYASRTDTTEMNIDEDTKKQLDKINEAKVNLNVENGLPIGFKVTGYLVDSLNRKLFYFTREKGTGASDDTVFTIEAGLIDAEGKVVQVRKQSKTILLSKTDAQKLKSAKKAIFNVIYWTTDGKKVILSSKDFIKFKSTVSFSVKVDFD
ncbi:MAG: hypothetical protein N3F03_07385 [Ignavibacteria bacterium]|nr:hypothetical protein [Ignavibacteria bacterium]